MKLIIAIVSAILLAGVVLLVMVGPTGLTGLFSSHKTASISVHPIAQSENPPVVASSIAAPTKTQKFLPKATTTEKVVTDTPKQPSAKVSTTTPSTVPQPSVVTSEVNPEIYFQKAIAQYSALVSAELKNKNIYPPNSTSSSVATVLSSAYAQQYTALAFSVFKIEEYKSLYGRYPQNFILKISMPLVTTEYAFTRSADGKTFKLCQSSCIDSKNGIDFQSFDKVLMNVENIQNLFNQKWIIQSNLQARDEIIMSSLKNIRVEAELKYDANKSSYAGVCVSTSLNNARQAALAPEKVICSDSANAAAAEAYLPFREAYFCVDTTGHYAESAKSKGAGALACPQ